MKTLDPNDIRCCFCDQPIQNNEVVAVIEAPGGLPAVTHMDHTGVRQNLVTHPCQITTGALLRDVALLTDDLSKFIDHMIEAVDFIRVEVERIKKEEGNDVGNGTIPCPVCGAMLCYFIQANGHIHGKCSTEDCLDFRQ